jgi:arginine decarboxylase
MPIVEALEKYKSSGRLRLHMPGHKGRVDDGAELSRIFCDEMLAADITEIAGMDDLHAPEGIIRDAEALAAELFGADRTFFLVNGTTSGIMAAIAAVAGEDEPLLVARDCHKSVTRGLVLGGARPVYIMPHVDRESGLAAGISVEDVREAFRKNLGVRGIVLSHPSYYGTYSDLQSIVDIAHSHGAIVIADEAHGAELAFTAQDGIPEALAAGADIAVQSTHKMLGSLTQSSMLHVQGTLVDMDRLEYYVSMMTSTSPSYLLMASLDAVRCEMHARGREIWQAVLDMTADAADVIDEIPGMACVRTFESADGEKKPLEGSRLLVSAADCGISGRRLGELLYREYNIDVEFSDDRYVIVLLGSHSKRADMDAFVAALRGISHDYYNDGKSALTMGNARHIDIDMKCASKENSDTNYYIEEMKHVAGTECTCEYENQRAHDSGHICEIVNLTAPAIEAYLTPRKAVTAPHSTLELRMCEGMVAASEIAIYPPGIPLVEPGEIISVELIDYLYERLEAGWHIHGIKKVNEDGIEKYVIVVAEDESRKMLFNCVF